MAVTKRASAKKKAVRKSASKKSVTKKVKEQYVYMSSGELDYCDKSATVDGAKDKLRHMIADDGADSYYNMNRYYIIKIVETVEVNIELPPSVVKLHKVTD